MRHLAIAMTLSLPAVATAQQVDINAGPGGFSMRANVRQGQTAGATASSSVESGSDGFRIEYQSNPDGTTFMRVLAPEGAPVQVFDGKKLIAEDDIPMSFKAQGEKFYRVSIKMPDGSVWEKKLAARKGQTGSIWVSAPVPPPPVAVDVQTPPADDDDHDRHHRRDRGEFERGHGERHHGPPAPPPGPQPMPEGDFRALKSAVESESFSAQKLGVLETAMATAWFSVNQVGELVDLFSFSQEKVRVVELTRGRILDRQNAFQLYSHFEFSGDKDQVKKLLVP